MDISLLMVSEIVQIWKSVSMLNATNKIKSLEEKNVKSRTLGHGVLTQHLQQLMKYLNQQQM